MLAREHTQTFRERVRLGRARVKADPARGTFLRRDLARRALRAVPLRERVFFYAVDVLIYAWAASAAVAALVLADHANAPTGPKDVVAIAVLLGGLALAAPLARLQTWYAAGIAPPEGLHPGPNYGRDSKRAMIIGLAACVALYEVTGWYHARPWFPTWLSDARPFYVGSAFAVFSATIILTVAGAMRWMYDAHRARLWREEARRAGVDVDAIEPSLRLRAMQHVAGAPERPLAKAAWKWPWAPRQVPTKDARANEHGELEDRP